MSHPGKEWLNLTETAALLGVHPGTVRNWSNRGELPVHRTQGGHRRYRRDEVLLWMQSRASDETPNAVVQSLYQALRNIRFTVSEGKLAQEDWYTRLDERARIQYRMSGRNLLQGLITSMSGTPETASNEARSLGYEYASRARLHDLSLVEATRAFLFFRSIVLDALMESYQSASVSTAGTWRVAMEKVITFTDQVLMALLETFEAYEHPQSQNEDTASTPA
ncbi:MAG: hypothetical protein Fur0018_02380 [Anaerolineales bacterium]